MQYMLLLYSDRSGWDALSPEERDGWMGAYMAYAQDLRAAGALLAGDELHAASTATTISMIGGTRRVQDGPFAASKEELGGYFLIDVPDLDAALDWAARCPGARHGHVEVRPVVQNGP